MTDVDHDLAPGELEFRPSSPNRLLKSRAGWLWILVPALWPLWLTFFWGGGDSLTQLAARGLVAFFLIALVGRGRGRWVGFLIVGALSLLATLDALVRSDSWSRQYLLYYTKLAQIRRGRLAFCPQWGWVDRRHRLVDVLDKLKAAEDREVTVHHLFFGSPDGTGYELVLEGGFSSSLQRLRAVQMLGERCEWEESQLPWWTGAPVSAYNSDDLSSVYFTLMEEAHPGRSWTFETPEVSEWRWKQEGWSEVQRRTHRAEEFQPRSSGPAFRELIISLEKQETVFRMRRRGPLALSST